MATKNRAFYSWTNWLAASLVAAALVGCGGGGGGETAAVTPPVVTPPVVTPPAAPTVAVPTGTAPVTLTATTPAATFAALAPTVAVGGVTIASPPCVSFSMADAAGNGIIGFGSTSKSATATVASYPNLAFVLAKLVPGTNGAPSKWVSYIVTTVPTKNATTGAITASVPTRPTSDSNGTLTDNKNGTYTYCFYRDVKTIKDQVAAATLTGLNVAADLGDLTYDPNALHRMTIQIAGNAPGTGSNTADGVTVTTAVPMSNPLNVVYDFIPATGKAVAPTDTGIAQRLIVDKASCNECHGKLGGIPGTESATFHGGSRYDPKYCVVCHTDQRKYGQARAVSTNNAFPVDSKGAPLSTYVADGVTVGDFPVLIHRVHKGEELIKQNYNFAGVLLNETLFPQDLRNCTKCHDGTAPKVAPQAANFQNVPSRLACGACHDGIDFAKGTGTNNSTNLATGLHNTWGHIGGVQADDSKCALCHDAASIKSVYHLAITPPNAANGLVKAGGSNYTNAAWIASNTSNLPPGAIKVTYDISSVSRTASKNPQIVFKMLQNGVAQPFSDPTKATELWPSFFGAPSLYFVWAVPQDGIAAPADFNASASAWLKSIWNNTATGAGAGTLTGPDANGYYTATLTGVQVPDSAVMFSGGLGYTYNLGSTPPLTQTGVADPIGSNATFNQTRFGVTASTIKLTGENKIGGLIVVAPDAQKVASGYTARRTIVDDALCNKCHLELGMFTGEAFHAGQRNDGTSCAWCHTPNKGGTMGWPADSSYFVHAIHASSKRTVPYTWESTVVGKSFNDVGYPGILSKCETCHVSTGYDFANVSAATIASRLYRTTAYGTYNKAASALAAFQISPYVDGTAATNYGPLPAYVAAAGTITPDAAGTNLVISPITTACSSCHDTTVAIQHMESNGGSHYKPRATALAKAEQCMFCHSSTSAFGLGIKAVHAN